MHRLSKIACLVIFFSRLQPAALDMLQNELVTPQNESRNPTTLKKDLQIKKLQKHSLLSQTLILHVEKLLGLSLKLSNHKY